MNRTILLVEDESVTALLESAILKKNGFDVVWAESGKKALEIMGQRPLPDLVLMDIDLGTEQDGTYFAEEILKKYDIPLIFLSSHTEPEVVQKTEGITSYGYIVKSSGETVIIASIKMAFKLFRAIRKEKLKELELEQSEEYLTQILQTSRDGFWVIDQFGNMLDVNAAYCQMSGYSREEFIRLKISDIDAIQSPVEIEEKTKFIVQNGSDLFETKHRKKDSSIFDVEVSVTYIEKYGGRFFCFCRDISLRNQRKELLEKNEEMLRTVVNTLHQSIFWKDTKGFYIGCNQVFAETVGKKSPEEVIGLTDFDLPWPKEEAHAYREDDQYVIQNNISKLHIIEPLQTVDGTRIWIDTSKMPLRRKNGTVFGVIGIYEDITDRKTIEEERTRLLEEKEILLREVHHRMKNNFASIESMLYIQTESIQNLEAKRILQDAMGRIKSIRVVYDRLLLDKSYKEISFQSYLSNLLESILSIFSDSEKIELNMDIQDFEIDVKKALPIGIILNELITNTMKYAFLDHPNPKIDVSIKIEGMYINMILQDNGKGLPESFVLETEDGLGLGLVNMLARQMGGSYKIENQNGTKNTVKIKL